MAARQFTGMEGTDSPAADGKRQQDRDDFAKAALTGLLSQGTQGTFSKAKGVALAAEWAYEYADAMLAERDKAR